MTINFSGTTLADLTEGLANAATRESNTTAAQLAPYALEGVKLFGDDGGEVIEVAASATKYVSCYFYTTHTAGTRAVIQLLDGGTSLFEILHSSGNLSARYWNGSTWSVLGTTAVSASILYKLDVRVTMDNSSGVFNFYIDDSLVQSFSGDTIYTASTTLDEVLIRNGSATDTDATTFSALIIADEETRDIVFQSLKPTGAGTNSGWTGAYTTVDESGIDDSDFITVSSAAQTSTFAMTNTNAAFATNYEVVGLGVCARSSRGSSGVGYVKPAVYSNVTLGTGTSTPLDVTWGRAYHIFTQDPDTATTWTIGGIDAAELGVQSSAS